MYRGVDRILRGPLPTLPALSLAVLGSFLSGDQAQSAAPVTVDIPPITSGGLFQIQADEPMPAHQRDDLEELREKPSATDLRPIIDLYLKRGIKLSDKDYDTFTKILETTRMLESLEEQRRNTGQAAPPVDTGEARTRAEQEQDPPPPTATDPSLPSPPLELDLLYHRAKRMRPL